MRENIYVRVFPGGGGPVARSFSRRMVWALEIAVIGTVASTAHAQLNTIVIGNSAGTVNVASPAGVSQASINLTGPIVGITRLTDGNFAAITPTDWTICTSSASFVRNGTVDGTATSTVKMYNDTFGFGRTDGGVVFFNNAGDFRAFRSVNDGANAGVLALASYPAPTATPGS